MENKEKISLEDTTKNTQTHNKVIDKLQTLSQSLGIVGNSNERVAILSAINTSLRTDLTAPEIAEQTFQTHALRRDTLDTWTTQIETELKNIVKEVSQFNETITPEITTPEEDAKIAKAIINHLKFVTPQQYYFLPDSIEERIEIIKSAKENLENSKISAPYLSKNGGLTREAYDKFKTIPGIKETAVAHKNYIQQKTQKEKEIIVARAIVNHLNFVVNGNSYNKTSSREKQQEATKKQEEEAKIAAPYLHPNGGLRLSAFEQFGKHPGIVEAAIQHRMMCRDIRRNKPLQESRDSLNALNIQKQTLPKDPSKNPLDTKTTNAIVAVLQAQINNEKPTTNEDYNKNLEIAKPYLNYRIWENKQFPAGIKPEILAENLDKSNLVNAHFKHAELGIRAEIKEKQIHRMGGIYNQTKKPKLISFLETNTGGKRIQQLDYEDIASQLATFFEHKFASNPNLKIKNGIPDVEPKPYKNIGKIKDSTLELFHDYPGFIELATAYETHRQTKSNKLPEGSKKADDQTTDRQIQAELTSGIPGTKIVKPDIIHKLNALPGMPESTIEGIKQAYTLCAEFDPAKPNAIDQLKMAREFCTNAINEIDKINSDNIQ